MEGLDIDAVVPLFEGPHVNYFSQRKRHFSLLADDIGLPHRHQLRLLVKNYRLHLARKYETKAKGKYS